MVIDWSFGGLIQNPILLIISIGQVAAGAYGAATGSPKVGAVTLLVGVANVILSTVKA